MKKRTDGQITGLAGELFIAAEQLKRDLQVTPFDFPGDQRIVTYKCSYEPAKVFAWQPRCPSILSMVKVAEYVAGRRCAVFALRKLGELQKAIPRDQWGAPVWPLGVTGSISHSGGVAISSVCRQSHFLGLGIDVEEVMSKELADEIRETLMSPDELKQFGCRSLEDITAVFSLKESAYKATRALPGAPRTILDTSVLRLEPSGLAIVHVPSDRGGLCLEGRTQQEGGCVYSAVVLPPVESFSIKSRESVSMEGF